MAGIGQDAKDDTLAVGARVVLWKLPREFRDWLPRGLKQPIPDKAGASGPWIGERFLGA